MIASERSLASSHQPQTPKHRKQTTLGKARNGAAKPPVRPVKIYVIDPRKLQQRLEAYVDQKNQKRAAAEKEKEKEKGVKSNNNDDKPSTPTVPSNFPVQSTANHTSTTHSTSVTKSPPPKLLPVLAPKLQGSASPSPNLASNSLNLNQQESSSLGNGVTFQSLQCINAAGLGIPALPLVVTNGVALIQPAISSQSSIPTSGLFLPGLTAIPSVIPGDGTLIGQTSQQQQQALQTKAKQKLSTTQKRKAKKKKAAKKRKVEAKERDEEEADRELSYLLKETTTRLGRVSRPVSQPHSPSVVTSSLSATSSRAPSPNSKLKKKVIRKEVAFRCENCVQSFVSKEQLNCHYNEFPQHHQTTHEGESVVSSSDSSSVRLPSTNFDNQGTQLLSPQISHSATLEITNATPPEIAITSESLQDNKNTNNVMETASQASGTTIYDGIQESLPVPSHTRVDTLSLESLSRNVLFSSAANKGNIMTEMVTQNGYLSSSSIENDTEMHASLVPSNKNENELFQSSMSSSNVVQVPSSYSIPSSPPSRCQSPGLPDMFTSGSVLAKERGNSPMGSCNSPVDPMLLRSRSPFPPPIPETSLHSVGASNLSIPEESLCKGELFMDLGDGVLESSRLSAISPTPFGNESSIDHLFENSGIKDTTLEKPPDVEVTDSNPPCTEQSRDSSSNAASGPSIRAPMLLETTMEDANDGEIFQTANYARTFLHPSVVSSMTMPSVSSTVHTTGEERTLMGRNFSSCPTELPRTPQSTCLESDVSMDSSETQEGVVTNNHQKSRSVWHFVKDQIKFRGISQVLHTENSLCHCH